MDWELIMIFVKWTILTSIALYVVIKMFGGKKVHKLEDSKCLITKTADEGSRLY